MWSEELREFGHVPWMHVFEWQQVYCDLLSNDLQEKRRGYEKLLLWKSRKPKIPTGIECTIELVYADLLVKNAFGSETRMFGEQEMQVMMSSAIMRFLNLVIKGSLVKDSNSSQTFKEVAASVDLPEWVVDLRHSTAHYTEMPSFDSLYKGVKCSLDWLLENYWQEGNNSANLTTSLSAPTSGGRNEVQEILDAWESLNVCLRSGIFNMNHINFKHDLKVFIENHFGKISYNDGKDINLRKKSHRELSFIIPRVGVKLLETIEDYCFTNEKIVILLMESKTFIPSRNLLKAMETPGHFYMGIKDMMKWLVNIWKPLLEELQKTYSVYPSLIHELVMRQVALGNKCSTRQHIMSLWIKELCGIMIKSQSMINMYIQHEEHNESELKQGFKNKDPELSDANFTSGNFCEKSIIEVAVLSANEFTSLFLPSLLEVVWPPLSVTSKRVLIRLVSIHFSSTGSKQYLSSDPIHTVQELFPEKSLPIQSEVDVSTAEWFKCPLGALPWSHKIESSLDFPESVKWVQNKDKERNIARRQKIDHKERGKSSNAGVNINARRGLLKEQRQKIRRVEVIQ